MVYEFLTADVDGQSGFLAITTHRMIFFARERGGLRAVREHPLRGVAEVKLLRRGVRKQLRIGWDDGEMLIQAADDRWHGYGNICKVAERRRPPRADGYRSWERLGQGLGGAIGQSDGPRRSWSL